MPRFKVHLTQEEEYELIKKAQHGDEDARNELIERNEGFLWSQAKTYAKNHGGEGEDYFGQATLSYIRCIEKFEVDRGLRLSTYAGVAIQNALRTCSRNEAHLIRVPNTAQVAVRHNKPINPQIIAAARVAMTAHSKVVPTIPVFVKDYRFQREKLESGVRRVVGQIKGEIERKIVEMILDRRSFREIASILGVSHQRVSQRFKLAIKQMQKILGVDLEEAQSNAQGGARAVQQPNSQGTRQPHQRRTRNRPSGDRPC